MFLHMIDRESPAAGGDWRLCRPLHRNEWQCQGDDWENRFQKHSHINCFTSWNEPPFISITHLSFRTKTSWRSFEVRQRTSVRGWVSTGCLSPLVQPTSWVWSAQPRWIETRLTQIASMVIASRPRQVEWSKKKNTKSNIKPKWMAVDKGSCNSSMQVISKGRIRSCIIYETFHIIQICASLKKIMPKTLCFSG